MFEAPNQNPPQVLLQNVDAGRQWFHMVAVDSMGYATLNAAHYEIDIGTAPAMGTLAGTVSDSQSMPIVGAMVVVQRGLYTATTVAGGVYNFNDDIPAGTYEVVALAPSMQSQAQLLTVAAGMTTDGTFNLTTGTGCPSCADPCSGIDCSQVGTPPPWISTCEQGLCASNVGFLGGSCTSNDQCFSDYCGYADVCVTSCLSGLKNPTQYYDCTVNTQCCVGTTCKQNLGASCTTDYCCEP